MFTQAATFAKPPQTTDTDERDVAQLFELVAANRRAPVPKTALERTRASLAALRAEVGTPAWRVGIGAALRAAMRHREPLKGNVAPFVADVARRAALIAIARRCTSSAAPRNTKQRRKADAPMLGSAQSHAAMPMLSALHSTDDEAELILGPIT